MVVCWVELDRGYYVQEVVVHTLSGILCEGGGLIERRVCWRVNLREKERKDRSPMVPPMGGV